MHCYAEPNREFHVDGHGETMGLWILAVCAASTFAVAPGVFGWLESRPLIAMADVPGETSQREAVSRRLSTGQKAWLLVAAFLAFALVGLYVAFPPTRATTTIEINSRHQVVKTVRENREE